jgi:hypothetical protein
MDTRASIGLTALRVRQLNPLQNGLVLNSSLTRWTTPPCVVSARAHSKKRAHLHDFVVFLVEVDEREDVRFRAEVNAMAFQKVMLHPEDGHAPF